MSTTCGTEAEVSAAQEASILESIDVSVFHAPSSDGGQPSDGVDIDGSMAAHVTDEAIPVEALAEVIVEGADKPHGAIGRRNDDATRAAPDAEEARGEAETLPPPDDGGLSLLRHLPPLPRPHYAAMLQERAIGASLTGVICAICIGIVHGLVSAAEKWSHGDIPDVVCFVVVYVAYGLSGMAVVLELFLLLGCKGVIRRSKTTTLPLPPEVLAYLQKTEASQRPEGQVGMRNLVGSDGRTYCVRCCVWREESRPAKPFHSPMPCIKLCDVCEVDDFDTVHSHHCSTCGSCVDGYDHHCGVLGVCITETNMFAFRGLLTLGVLGPLAALLIAPTILSVATLLAVDWAHGGPIAVTILVIEVLVAASSAAFCTLGNPLECLLECAMGGPLTALLNCAGCGSRHRHPLGMSRAWASAAGEKSESRRRRFWKLKGE